MAMLRNPAIAPIPGCGSLHPPGDAYARGEVARARPSCPDGTMMICSVDNARGCRCGELIVLN